MLTPGALREIHVFGRGSLKRIARTLMGQLKDRQCEQVNKLPDPRVDLARCPGDPVEGRCIGRAKPPVFWGIRWCIAFWFAADTRKSMDRLSARYSATAGMKICQRFAA
jgi:hypothetical protein